MNATPPPTLDTLRHRRIVVTGATGFIGHALVDALADAGAEVIALSRNAVAAQAALPRLTDAVTWQATEELVPPEALAGAFGVVNLIGESVASGPWTDGRRERIRDSRVVSTENLVSAMRAMPSPPKVLVSASAVGYYGDRGDVPLAEDVPPASDFLAELCREWENEAAAASEFGVRVTTLRIGLVIGPDGGTLSAMLTPFRLGLGGRLGSGRQWWSWIHRSDLARLIRFALTTEVRGAMNATSPEPVRQDEFARTLARVLGRPALVSVPAFALRVVLGGLATELLSSKRVVPQKALGAGFHFEHPDLEGALRDALGSSTA